MELLHSDYSSSMLDTTLVNNKYRALVEEPESASEGESIESEGEEHLFLDHIRILQYWKHYQSLRLELPESGAKHHC